MRKSVLLTFVLLLAVAGMAAAEQAPAIDPAVALGLTATDCPAPAAPVAPTEETASADDLLVELSNHGGPPFEECNEVVCGPNFFCCNRSCSICAPDGGFCTQQVCE